MTEIQRRPVVGYEGFYEASSDGHIYSVARVIYRGDGHPMTIKPRACATRARNGYLFVTVSREGVRKTFAVHRLVARAFVGERPVGYDICHGDGDRQNNSAGNLRYDSRSENNRDAVRHGTHFNASKVRCAKGHPYDESNTRRRKNGGRICATCKAADQRRRDARKAAA